MSVNITVFWIIIGCALVTLIPRILPFIIVRNIQLPPVAIKWLSFIPVCIFTALVADSLINKEADSLISMDWNVILALIPTILTALYTKSMAITVIVGVVCMAGIRFIM
ncbi:AzlD domain-containing protein [Paenibacillus agilis]|uniref:AzlD domain-containing protein n=1 Tax=Paenibacillus agilis TaxID=3020863 RepID=A0A559J012_9BACL|nr:AzlD domain-containing protein [Paenibacillus agilis]TVX93219.1 AzlD domain-containing protein [Paenibacillus agilis]